MRPPEALEREHGAVAIVVAICLVVLMGAVAFSVDVGGMLQRRREMVNGADAAALAGALTYLRGENYQKAADDQFRLNSPGSVSDNPGGIIAMPVQITGNLQKGSLTVRYTTHQRMYFSQVLGLPGIRQVTTTATATWSAGSLGNGTIELECGEDQATACGPGNKVPFCHYAGSSNPGGGGSGKYNMPNASTRATGPSGHVGHAYDVIPGYWFKQNNRAQPSYYAGVNWPVIQTMPSSPVDYTWMIGMSAESFIAGSCSGEGPRVWLSN